MAIDAIRAPNPARSRQVGDDEIAARSFSNEIAYRMQSSAPELIDLSDETDETPSASGVTLGERSFANNCLLARRIGERDMRFVTLYHTNRDPHGNKGTDPSEGPKKVRH